MINHKSNMPEDVQSVISGKELFFQNEDYIAHLAAIVEFSDDAIISKSLEGIIKSWNKGSEKMFGYTAKEVIGENISLIIPDEFLEEEKKIIEKILNNEIVEHYETCRNRKSGEQFYVSLTVSPLKDKEGKIIGISKIARDITSRKKSEELIVANEELVFQNEEKEKRAEELIKANREVIERTIQLESANKELESFSYSVSHDLRAPLRAVNGYAKILEEDYNTLFDTEGKRLLKEVQKNANKMGVLIDDLLAFSRLGKKEIKKSVIDMNNLTEAVLSEIKQTTHHHAQIKFSKLLPVMADYDLLVQVMANLLSNAIKYSSKKENPVIEITSKKENEEVIYSIKDNGVGFDMLYVNKLFGVFQRLHSEVEFEGTGVGLAIVQRIINKHNGKTWAVGKIDEGATFFFNLPVIN